MTDYKEVPILTAKQIAEECDKDQVIIIAWDAAYGRTHVTTFGKTKEDSARAAEGGNFVKEALGWPNELCHDAPGWWKDNVEEIGRLSDTVDNYIAATNLPMPPKFHLEQLKDVLKKVSAKLKEIYVDTSGTNPWVIDHIEEIKNV